MLPAERKACGLVQKQKERKREGGHEGSVDKPSSATTLRKQIFMEDPPQAAASS